MGQSIILKILIADSTEKILKISDQELQDHHLSIVKSVTMKGFTQSIRKKDFDLVIIHPDQKTFQTDELIPLISSAKKPFIAILSPFVDESLTDSFYKAGVTEIIPGLIPDKLLLQRIKIFQKQNINYRQTDQLKSDIEVFHTEALEKTKIHKKLRAELSNEISEHVSSIIEYKKINQLLSVRNRELFCLINIAELNRKEHKLESFLEQIVELIPTAFQYPKQTHVEVSYNWKHFGSSKDSKTAFAISEEIQYNSVFFGTITVYLKPESFAQTQKPFLTEEKQLLRTIANNLSHQIHRKRTDNQLKIFLRAIDQSPLMISISNAKTKKVEYINPMFSKVSGYNLEELNSAQPYRSTQDKIIKPVIEEMREAVLKGDKWNGTYQNRTKEGFPFWQRTSLYPLIQDGSITHVLSIGENISKDIEIEEELKIKKEDYEHISQNAPGGILIVSKEGEILYANKKASEVSGYSNNELVGATVSDLIHPDSLSDIKENLDRRLRGELAQNNYEAKVITKEGETKTVEVAGALSRWKGEIVDLIVVNDITAKTRFSDLLKIQNEIDYMSTIPKGLNQSFQEIFKTLFRFDWIDGGGIYLMNKANNELNLVYSTGVSSEFKKETQQYLFGSEQFNMVQQQRTIYMKSIESKGMPQVVIEEGLKSLLVIPLIHDNKAIGSLNLASKLRTELSKNEQLIFEAIATRIAQMVTLIFTQEELQLKNQKLQDTLIEIQEKQQLLIQKSKLESLGEMAAGVAHEINQPLGIISLSLENILFKVSSKKATIDYLTEKLDSIFNNINKIDEIINHIRTFSRDQKSIIIEQIDINKVIEEAYSLVNEQYSFYDISIVLDLENEIGFALGNSHKLEQVIYNLFSNAKYALEEKDAALSESSFNKEIVVKTYRSNHTIHLDIEDNGTGIDENKMGNVFNPFFTTKPEGAGTGLGLSIVYGIISEMNGTIKIESEINEFTKVKIELPRH